MTLANSTLSGGAEENTPTQPCATSIARAHTVTARGRRITASPEAIDQAADEADLAIGLAVRAQPRDLVADRVADAVT